PTYQRTAIGIQRPGRRGLVPQQQHAQHEPASPPQPASSREDRLACWEREGARRERPRGWGCRPGRGCWRLISQRTALTGASPSRTRQGSRFTLALLVEKERVTEADAVPGREQVGHMGSQALLIDEGSRAAAQVDQTIAASPTQAG